MTLIYNMKIAILFYGYARTIGQLIHEYRISLPKNADIFIQTNHTFYAEPCHDTIMATPNITFTSRQYFENIFGATNIKGYQSVVYNPDKYKKFITDNNLPTTNFANQQTYRILPFFDNVRMVINMKKDYENKNNFKYDAIILTRLDLCLNSQIIIPNNLNKISFPNGEGYYPNFKRKYGAACVHGTDKKFNDQIIIGKSELIDVFSNLYDNVIYLCKERNIEFNSETLFGHFMMINGIEFSEENICSYVIFR